MPVPEHLHSSAICNFCIFKRLFIFCYPRIDKVFSFSWMLSITTAFISWDYEIASSVPFNHFIIFKGQNIEVNFQWIAISPIATETPHAPKSFDFFMSNSLLLDAWTNLWTFYVLPPAFPFLYKQNSWCEWSTSCSLELQVAKRQIRTSRCSS